MSAAPPVSLAAAVEHASGLLATDLAAAERQARAILAQVPGDPRAQLILGSALRRQGRAADARSIVEPLARAFPRAALTHYELGQALAALGDPAGAIAALRQAVSVQRDLPDAWAALGALL